MGEDGQDLPREIELNGLSLEDDAEDLAQAAARTLPLETDAIVLRNLRGDLVGSPCEILAGRSS
jgi:hypothetical protein